MEIDHDIFMLMQTFLAEEKFGIVSQMKRCSVSIPSNIAEGAARNSKKEFLNFLYIASGSLSELDTQLEPSKRFNFIDELIWKKFDNKLIELNKLLIGLIRSQKENVG